MAVSPAAQLREAVRSLLSPGTAGAQDEPKPEPWWDGSYMLLPFRSDAGGDDAGTLRGPDRVLSALLFARVASSFARMADTTLCAQVGDIKTVIHLQTCMMLFAVGAITRAGYSAPDLELRLLALDDDRLGVQHPRQRLRAVVDADRVTQHILRYDIAQRYCNGVAAQPASGKARPLRLSLEWHTCIDRCSFRVSPLASSSAALQAPAPSPP